MATPTIAVNDREHRKRHPLVCDLPQREFMLRVVTVVDIDGVERTGELIGASSMYHTPYEVCLTMDTDAGTVTFRAATGTDTPDGRVAYECIDHSTTIIHDTL